MPRHIPTMIVSQPASQITIPQPISYDFRVIEFMKDSKLEKVELQVRTLRHDQYGNVVLEEQWESVPRFKMIDGVVQF